MIEKTGSYKEMIIKAANDGKLVVLNEKKAEQMLGAIGIQPSEASRIVDLAKTIIPQNSQKSSGSAKFTHSECDGQYSLGDGREVDAMTLSHPNEPRGNNGGYGSVIYDLKGEDHAKKNEIETAKYSLTDNNQQYLDNDDKKRYNDFEWATRRGFISPVEADNVYSKVHDRGTLDNFGHYSAEGEAIIDVNDDPNVNRKANNVFAFVKGTKADDLEITRVVRVNFDTEDMVEMFRGDIYKYASHGTLEAYAREIGEEFLEYYDRNDYPYYRRASDQSWTRSSGSESQGNSGAYRNGHQRRWTFEQDQDNDIAPVKTSSQDDVFSNGEGAKLSLSEENGYVPDDIRFSLSADSNGRQLSEAQKDYFKDSRVVGENGNLKIMDHGSDRFAKGNRHSKKRTFVGGQKCVFCCERATKRCVKWGKND